MQIFTPCPTNMKFPPDQTIKIAKEAEKDVYSFEEYISDEAAEYLKSLK